MFFSHFSRPKKRTPLARKHQASWYYFLALAQENADVFWIVTPTGKMQDASPSWRNFTGQREEACLGRGWLDALHPADQRPIEAILLQCVTSGQTAEMEGHIRRCDGFYRRVYIRAIPVHIPHEAIYEVIICANDLTKQERAGQMSDAQVQLAVKASLVGLWKWDFITNQLIWTAQEKALFGLPPSTPINHERFLEAVHPDDREYVQQLRKLASAKTAQQGQCYRTIWPDGSIHWLENRAQTLYDAQEQPICLVGATIDVTDLKLLEKALHESEVRFRGLVESNILGISVTDLKGHIYEANDALLSFLGYTREDLAAGRMEWLAMTPPEYMAQSLQKIEELLETGVMQPFEKEFITKAGTRVPVLLGSTLIRQEGSAPLFLTFILDLTDRKELEHQKDLMLGMTSHELKTPLAALKGTFQLLQRRLKRLLPNIHHVPPEVNEFLTDLAERLETCARQVDVQTHLINDLMDVSRITAHTLTLELDYCDLVSIVRATVEDLKMVAPERHFLLALPEHTTITIFADAARIIQVITNYVTNALRYSHPAQPIQVGLTVQENTARVWVRDKGPGLSAESQRELWQRFHQVKGVAVQGDSGKGLGLGLYICQTLIAQHQGEVGVESAPGEGSTFWFTLPIAK
ncbi:MAG: PAS domain S-box protein [Ktedonobacteraceae bacterium]